MASSSSSSPEISAASAATSQQFSVQYADLSREEVLEELSSRFILNLPEEELASVERVCFQVEQAHWYYEDFIREQNPSKFPSYTLKTFSEALFRSCPLLHHWASDHDRTFQSFMQYKTRVPVCGAIMLNDTWEKCLLVKGWKSSAGWGFPKGKINEQEPRPRCAVREVLEETGYDLESRIVPEDVIELSIKDQSISLYIVPGVPEDFPFKTRTRKEISKIAWFKLTDLPTWKRSKSVPGKFYLISPFIGPLKAFINSRKPRNVARKPRRPQNGYHADQTVTEAQGSSEEDVPVTENTGIFKDTGVLESSSQSSSADNGEPQTPSPLYSAPPVQPNGNLVFVNSSTEVAVSQALNLDVVDPHFARLLSSLSLSASASTVTEDKASAQHDSTALQQNQSAASFENDWSAHMPSLTKQPPVQATVPPSTGSSTPYSPAALYNAHPPIRDNSTPSPSRSKAVVASTLSVSIEAAARSPPTKHARSGSKATADLSPYLSRPQRVPRDISKEMKYISMLENVVKESDRISNFGTQSFTPQPLASLRPASRSAVAPGPSAFVPPPPAMFGNRMQAPPNHLSGVAVLPPPPPASQIPPLNSELMRDPFIVRVPHDDPFTVRPRTSNAFRPVPYPPSRPVMGAVPSQLTMPTPDPRRFPPNPPQYMGHPPLPPRSIGPPHTQLHAPHPNVPPALRIVPPNQLTAARMGEPAPLSAPALSPSFNLAPPINPPRLGHNAHLLSILNSPNTVPRMPVTMTQPAYGAMGTR
ncbi:DCP2-domain-containing protein [Obba rivulosa]|uniref:DCP2-domain-containing protein n=1 Tax=Obba rivulosa TaxID=1052685 RepID=A0A8E2DUW4_9APHY|nr:DCP2-domain-containing protein [Obba rivulosa]